MASTKQRNSPVISIGMPVYNGERFLRAALDSLLSQTFTDLELVISDNASTDRTTAICEEYRRRDARIRYYRQPQNVGVFPNVQFIMEQVRGEFFMVVGDDDVYEPTYLEELMPLLRANPDLDLVYSDYAHVDPQGKVHASGLKTFLTPAHGRPRNYASFIRTRICLPMMMGVFRTASFVRALPFAKFKDGMTGGVDLVFLFRFLSYAQVDSVRKVLFYYRLKDRSNVVPPQWMTSPWRLKWHQFQLNRTILTQHIFSSVKHSQFGALQKAWLRSYALLVFVLDFTLLPIAYRLKRKAGEMSK